MGRNGAYRAVLAVALAAAFILVWRTLPGIIGSEDNAAVGIIGASIARFEPHGMARALRQSLKPWSP